MGIRSEEVELVKKIFTANTQTIEVLRSSSPYAIVWSQQNPPAIVYLMHNSQKVTALPMCSSATTPRGTPWTDLAQRRLAVALHHGLQHSLRSYLYVSQGEPLYHFGYGQS